MCPNKQKESDIQTDIGRDRDKVRDRKSQADRQR